MLEFSQHIGSSSSSLNDSPHLSNLGKCIVNVTTPTQFCGEDNHKVLSLCFATTGSIAATDGRLFCFCLLERLKTLSLSITLLQHLMDPSKHLHLLLFMLLLLHEPDSSC